MADQFSRSVDYGFKLSKRIYYGEDPSAAPAAAAMERLPSLRGAAAAYLPAAPMVYAVISEPWIVENPDIPSYQPYVHGRCDPPALIPLHMHEISMEVDCYVDTAFVTVTGTWRVHCVTATKSCDCRVAVPVGEQGSLLGAEVDVGKSYYTQLMTLEDTTDLDKVAKPKDEGFLTPHIYTLKVPQVYGGSILSLKASWSQRLSYHDGQCCLCIPFSFPEYVIPARTKPSQREKIQLNVNSGSGMEVLCKATSHPLKELRRQVGKLSFLYEAEVRSWSAVDFSFSYSVSLRDICGGLHMQSPSLHDFDQREMFCLYLFPGDDPSMKVFRKEVVFVIDISGSMHGMPIENVKNSLLAALSKFDGQDYFNIITFNGDTHLFSSSLERVTKESIENAAQWIDLNFRAEGDTNIFSPLNQAIDMFSKTSGSIPLIFLVTDGTVEDERHICSVMKDRFADQGSIYPRISTFGIGTYCNHYFLQMLAHIGRGHYDAVYDVEKIEFQLNRLITAATSVILANITIEAFDHLSALELYPSQIPDLVSGSPLVLSGRFNGKFPGSLQAKGIRADMESFVVDLKLQNVKDIPLDKVFARRQIDMLTAQAWFHEDKQIERRVANLSKGTGFPSEYTRMILVQNDKAKQVFEPSLKKEMHFKPNADSRKMVDPNGHKIVFLLNLGVGFGNLVATAKNHPPGIVEAKLQDTGGNLMKAACNCCGGLADRICCLCVIQACSWTNNQCGIACSQLCTALACFECLGCCFDLCASCD